MEKRSFLATELLCLFFGAFGAHRFYTGYIGIGVLQALTVGGCGLWALIDLICISLGKYNDVNDEELDDYNQVVGIAVIVLLVLFFLWLFNAHKFVN